MLPNVLFIAFVYLVPNAGSLFAVSVHVGQSYAHNRYTVEPVLKATYAERLPFQPPTALHCSSPVIGDHLS